MEGILTELSREAWSVRGQIERLLTLWCRTMHKDITWPTSGQYRCRSCGRRFAVPWAEQERFHWYPPNFPVSATLSHARTA